MGRGAQRKRECEVRQLDPHATDLPCPILSAGLPGAPSARCQRLIYTTCRVFSQDKPFSGGVAAPLAVLIRHPARAIPEFPVAAVEAHLQHWRSALA